MSLFSRVSPPSPRLIGSAARRLSRVIRGTPRQARGHKGQAGQALPLFVLMIFVLTGSVAVVTDVSWFWVNQQKMQRAADAGALAGAVFLPGDPADGYAAARVAAYAAARAATARNGYTDGVAGVTVTPVQETQNRRRLDVSVAGPIGTYFARVFGMSKINGSAASKAEFTLPVPMGSPQNYYGVGMFIHSTTTTSTNNPFTNGPNAPTAVTTTGTTGGAWTNPTLAYASDNIWATSGTNGNQEIWNAFNFGAFQSGAVIDGFQVKLVAKVSAAAAACNIKAEVTWNAGTAWGNLPLTTFTLTTGGVVYTLGSATDDSVWGSNHPSWAPGEFSSANFGVRLTYLQGSSCGTASLDQVTVVVSSHTTTILNPPTTANDPATNITSPTGGTLKPQNAWGAVITKGGSRQNGDEFSPQNDNASVSGHTSTNPEYTDVGYDYAVILPGGSGKVELFDPTFCAMGNNSLGGTLGAGDHWIGTIGTPVTTVFSLWNENGTPYYTGDDVFVTDSGALFANKVQADKSQITTADPYKDSAALLAATMIDCANDPYHNQWYVLAQNLPAGRYRLNVNTSSSANNSTSAENMWSAWVTSSGASPQVYGEAKMATYSNLVVGDNLFYLAQIDAADTGKTVEITLFDPGDVGPNANATIYFLSPNGNAYTNATFSYTADNGLSANNVDHVQIASGGSSLFDDAVLTIDIVLPNNYGSSGLTPSTETQAGWWKVLYHVTAGNNDTTTWQVAIKGSPVHLVP